MHDINFFFFKSFLWKLKRKCPWQPFTITINWALFNTIWLNNTKIPEGKKTVGSRAQEAAVPPWVDSQQVWALRSLSRSTKKGNGVLRRRPRASARRPSEPSITGARWQPPSPPAPAHLHLPLPPPLALAACQLPSASPLWCSERNFTAAVSLLLAHAR